MKLILLTEKERGEAAELLADYWKSRGMPAYDRKWAEAYLQEGHRKEIARDEFFIWKEQGKLCGVISLVTDVSGVAEIRDMVVKPEWRGKGYGQKMLDELVRGAAERKIRKLYALIFPPHEKLFQSAGFAKEGVLKSHFKEGEDLILMSRFLR